MIPTRSTSSSLQLLRALDIACVRVVTERKNHAHDYIRDLPKDDFRKFDAIMTVSGDGIPHEVINGFMLRSDHGELELNLGRQTLLTTRHSSWRKCMRSLVQRAANQRARVRP